jgi:hypothetical protein
MDIFSFDKGTSIFCCIYTRSLPRADATTTSYQSCRSLTATICASQPICFLGGLGLFRHRGWCSTLQFAHGFSSGKTRHVGPMLTAIPFPRYLLRLRDRVHDTTQHRLYITIDIKLLLNTFTDMEDDDPQPEPQREFEPLCLYEFSSQSKH